jgi:xanthine/uracil permease
MDNLNDLKAIWLTAKTDSLPDSHDMVQIIKKFRNKKLLKIAALVITAIVLVMGMTWVVFIYKSTMLSTRIGEAFIIIAGIILVSTNLNSLLRFYKLRECSNKEFLHFLEQTRLRQQFYYQRTQIVAMVFCATGLLAYLYEGVYKNTILFIGAYTGTVLYLLIIWFIVRPRVFKKEERKINAQIEKLESISKQINE